MPKYIPSSSIWCPIDPYVLARNWAATSKRMGSKAAMVRGLAQAVNQLAGQGRIMFQAWRHEATAFNDSGGADPLWQWKYLDTATNGRDRFYDCQVLPRVAGAGSDSEAYREGDSGTTSDALDTGSEVAAAVDYPANVRWERFDYARGNRADAEDTEGITVTNGATLTGLIVRDKGGLAEDVYTYDYDLCPVSSPWRGDECIANSVESVRATLQALRDDYLPILGGWTANDCTSAAQPSTTNAKGIKTTSTSYENALDTSFSSRTAVSPGSICFVNSFGRGPAASDDDHKIVKVRCYVLAEKTGAGNGTVKFEGPDTWVLPNNYEITVSDTTPTWYGSGSSVIALDSDASDEATGTGRNKIDVLIKVAASTTMWVYGWVFLMEDY